MLEIDGSQGEGGGQLVRCAVALAALTGTPIRLTRVRSKRHPPGLAAQHLAAVRCVAALCGAETPGLALHARDIGFVPGPVRGGFFHLDVGTAGSAVLVLQAAVPVALVAPAPVTLLVSGGTDVHGAPAFDYAQGVWQPLLRRIGLDVTLHAERRGYFPRGGGLVRAEIRPGVPRALSLPGPGAVRGIGGVAHSAGLPAHVVERMAAHAEERLSRHGTVALRRLMLGSGKAVGTGGAIALWADCEGAPVGASAVARRGVRAEAVAEEAASELAADLDTGANLDLHASDQLPVYLARAGGPSEYVVRRDSRHAATVRWLLGRFLDVRWETRATPDGGLRCRIRPG